MIGALINSLMKLKNDVDSLLEKKQLLDDDDIDFENFEIQQLTIDMNTEKIINAIIKIIMNHKLNDLLDLVNNTIEDFKLIVKNSPIELKRIINSSEKLVIPEINAFLKMKFKNSEIFEAQIQKMIEKNLKDLNYILNKVINNSKKIERDFKEIIGVYEILLESIAKNSKVLESNIKTVVSFLMLSEEKLEFEFNESEEKFVRKQLLSYSKLIKAVLKLINKLSGILERLYENIKLFDIKVILDEILQTTQQIILNNFGIDIGLEEPKLKLPLKK